MKARRKIIAATVSTMVVAGGIALAAPANAIYQAGCNNNTSNLIDTSNHCWGFANTGSMDPELNNIYQADGGVMHGYAKDSAGNQHWFSEGGYTNFQPAHIVLMCIQPGC